jgi:UDP-glucose 4-epimerase
MKRILITGEGSFIGTAVYDWLKQYPSDYQADILSVKDNHWETFDFSPYQTVVNVAGIAHRKITTKLEPLFYQVNRDLSVALCKKAEASGVKQYIYLSSMNVYGDINEIITKDTKPQPKNFYGNSKLQADEILMGFNSSTFHTVSIRPPVVYGKGCKGNYPLLEKLVKYLPVFPDYPNQRSILYISNLCEFIRLLIEQEESGIFHPQNKEYVSTTELVKTIAKQKHKRIYFTRLFNPVISFLLPRIRIVNRAFGNDLYDNSLSDYSDFSYCIVSFQESMEQMYPIKK